MTNVLDEVVKMAGKIVQALAPKKIILFGSYAYGHVTADSDLDLLIIMETDLPAAERCRQVSRLFYPRPIPMDIVVRTPKEIQRSLKRVDPFIHEIMEKGVILYARSGGGAGVDQES